METQLVVQCVAGLALGLWLHVLKKAKEHEKVTGQRVTVMGYLQADPKETGISVALAVMLIVGLPELTEVAGQVARQVFNVQLPALQRSFFLSALFGGFGNSLADIVAGYFGGERLKRFIDRS
jgi:hypothetical protein